jgi:hypothetical protein
VGSILTIEKAVGDMYLQKGFIADHVTKHGKPNSGELPKYYVEATMKRLSTEETFKAVHRR